MQRYVEFFFVVVFSSLEIDEEDDVSSSDDSADDAPEALRDLTARLAKAVHSAERAAA